MTLQRSVQEPSECSTADNVLTGSRRDQRTSVDYNLAHLTFFKKMVASICLLHLQRSWRSAEVTEGTLKGRKRQKI